jgi:hypothetical protein
MHWTPRLGFRNQWVTLGGKNVSFHEMESVSGVGEHHVEMTAQDTDTHKGSGY